MHTILYEELVTNPKNVIREALDFLDEAYEETLWRHRSTKSDPQQSLTSWEREHYRSTRRPLSSTSLDAWRTKLSPRDARQIERLNAYWMHKLGYTPAPSYAMIPSYVLGRLQIPGRKISRTIKKRLKIYSKKEGIN